MLISELLSEVEALYWITIYSSTYFSPVLQNVYLCLVTNTNRLVFDFPPTFTTGEVANNRCAVQNTIGGPEWVGT